MPPFVKWVGSKRASLDALMERVPAKFTHYHEPFLGSGALLFGLLDSGRLTPDQVAHGADTCWQLVTTWRAIAEEPDEVLRCYDAHIENHAKDYYYEQRGRSLVCAPEPEVAAWFLYINRAGFNGLWRTNKLGQCNVPWGKRAVASLAVDRQVMAASASLRGHSVRLRNAPYQQSLATVQPGDLVYLDPPFWPRLAGGFVGYGRNGFTQQDQGILAGIAGRLRDQGVHVLASNHDVPDVRDLYPGFEFVELQTRRSVNSDGAGRGEVSELLIVSVLDSAYDST